MARASLAEATAAAAAFASTPAETWPPEDRMNVSMRYCYDSFKSKSFKFLFK